MGFLDDVKVDQTLQIQALCVVFFLLAFPSYFFLKAAATDDPAGMGGLNDMRVHVLSIVLPSSCRWLNPQERSD